MAEWTYSLVLSDIYHSEAYSLAEKAHVIADRIERAPFFEKDWTFAIADVVDWFRDFSDEDDVGDFDSIMREFYDYANLYRVWVVTR